MRRIVVAALMAAFAGPLHAQEDTVMIAVITIQSDGEIVLQNRLGYDLVGEHLAGVSLDFMGRLVDTTLGLCSGSGPNAGCPVIRNGESHTVGHLQVAPGNVRSVDFNWGRRSTRFDDDLWCTEVAADLGRRWNCFEKNATGIRDRDSTVVYP